LVSSEAASGTAAEGTAAEVQRKRIVIDAYLGEEEAADAVG